MSNSRVNNNHQERGRRHRKGHVLIWEQENLDETNVEVPKNESRC